MNRLRRALCGGGFFGTAALLAGCSGAQPPAAGTEVPMALTMAHYVPATRHPDARKSWTSPDAKRIKILLYLSDWNTNDVFVYDYKTRKLVGTLTGFNEPYGECVDAKGDVYVANFGGATLVEYAHGGSAPIATLTTDGYTIGCSVDRHGNVAAANFYTFSGQGNVQIFAHGGGTPTNYTSSSCYYMWPPGYDDKGNLYMAGEYSTIAVCELPAGASSIRTVSATKQIYFPGAIMWDGKYLALTDQEYNGVTFQTGIAQATESASGDLTVVNETVLQDTCDGNYVDVIQPFVVGRKNTPVNRKEGTTVVGGNLWCTGSGVAIWGYPAGRDPIATISSAPTPRGQAVSIAP